LTLNPTPSSKTATSADPKSEEPATGNNSEATLPSVPQQSNDVVVKLDTSLPLEWYTLGNYNPVDGKTKGPEISFLDSAIQSRVQEDEIVAALGTLVYFARGKDGNTGKVGIRPGEPLTIIETLKSGQKKEHKFFPAESTGADFKGPPEKKGEYFAYFLAERGSLIHRVKLEVDPRQLKDRILKLEFSNQ